MIVINNKAHSTEKETGSFNGENLYVEPKSLLRRLIQKFFLKLLSKLFSKKFLFYKNDTFGTLYFPTYLVPYISQIRVVFQF